MRLQARRTWQHRGRRVTVTGGGVSVGRRLGRVGINLSTRGLSATVRIVRGLSLKTK